MPPAAAPYTPYSYNNNKHRGAAPPGFPCSEDCFHCCVKFSKAGARHLLQIAPALSFLYSHQMKAPYNLLLPSIGIGLLYIILTEHHHHHQSHLQQRRSHGKLLGVIATCLATAWFHVTLPQQHPPHAVVDLARYPFIALSNTAWALAGIALIHASYHQGTGSDNNATNNNNNNLITKKQWNLILYAVLILLETNGKLWYHSPIAIKYPVDEIQSSLNKFSSQLCAYALLTTVDSVMTSKASSSASASISAHSENFFKYGSILLCAWPWCWLLFTALLIAQVVSFQQQQQHQQAGTSTSTTTNYFNNETLAYTINKKRNNYDYNANEKKNDNDDLEDYNNNNKELAETTCTGGVLAGIANTTTTNNNNTTNTSTTPPPPLPGAAAAILPKFIFTAPSSSTTTTTTTNASSTSSTSSFLDKIHLQKQILAQQQHPSSSTDIQKAFKQCQEQYAQLMANKNA